MGLLIFVARAFDEMFEEGLSSRFSLSSVWCFCRLLHRTCVDNTGALGPGPDNLQILLHLLRSRLVGPPLQYLRAFGNLSACAAFDSVSGHLRCCCRYSYVDVEYQKK